MDKELKRIIYGRNPVNEALGASVPLEKIFFLHGNIDETMVQLRKKAQSTGVPYSFVDRRRLDFLASGGTHQGVVAKVMVRAYAAVEDILQAAAKLGEKPFLLACFQIQDPHNLGSLIRTGEAVGLHGILIPARKSVGLTATVSKVACGADSYVPLARVSNLYETLVELKNRGIKIYGAHPGRGEEYTSAEYGGPLVIVLGGEGRGLDKRLLGLCNGIVHIPLAGKINSLNVGVAGALILYEVFRHRRK